MRFSSGVVDKPARRIYVFALWILNRFQLRGNLYLYPLNVLCLTILGASIDYSVAKLVDVLSLGIKINIWKGGVDPLGRIPN